MLNQHHEQIEEVFTSVLEQLAFMFAELTPNEELPTDVESPVLVEIGFSGHSEGKLQLISPQSICHEMACNMLGLDEDEEDNIDPTHDALRELLNVTLGQLLTTIAGVKPVFDLSPPSVTPLTNDRWKEKTRDEQNIGFFVDDSPMLISFSMDQDS